MIKKGQLEESKSRLYFNIGHVFDISQTNAKATDLPEIFPNRSLEGEVQDYNVIMDALHQIGNNLNVTIGEPFEELGSAKGAYYFSLKDGGNRGHIGLNPRNGELQNIKTLIHELAHAKLHHGKNAFELSDAEKEFQAEMTAYSVASYFGINTNDYSLGYLANWTKGKEIKDKAKLLQEVRNTSVEFIQSIEKDLLKENMVEKEKEESKEQTQDELFLVKYEGLKGANGTFIQKDELTSLIYDHSDSLT